MKKVTEIIADLTIVKENNLFVHTDDRNLAHVEMHCAGEQIITLDLQFTDIMNIENGNYVVSTYNIHQGYYVGKYSILNNDKAAEDKAIEFMKKIFYIIEEELMKEEVMLLETNAAH